MIYEINSQQETKNLAQKFASKANIGDIFGLKGTLGAGKTFFASHFINFLLDKKTKILSPTFNLLHSYQTPKALIHHFDLYRLKIPEELEDIGFFDCLKNGICLIEWPEIAEQFLLKNYTKIDIKIKDGEGRLITFSNK